MLMFHMIQGTPLNLSTFMMHQIREALAKVKSCLAYGMVLTLVFKKFSVPIEGETSQKLMHSDTYFDQTIHRMGY